MTPMPARRARTQLECPIPRDSMCKKPRSARLDDGMYSWTPSILEHQLAYGLRRIRESVVPEGMKRQPQPPRIAPAA